MANKEESIEKKHICCIGAGYVGGPTMAVIAYKCPDYIINVVDISDERISQWNGPLDKLPVYEPGLSEIIEKTRNKNLFFSTEIDSAIKKSNIIFMAVNTPTKTKGEGKGMAADLKHVEECAKKIALVSESDKIIVEKSTAPLGTAQKIKNTLTNFNNRLNFEVISNPEFLAEGTAIDDLLHPDRVLIGGDKSQSGVIAVNEIVKIYNHWVDKNKIITTNSWSSELSKLASNAFLAQRISSINSLSALCDISGAEIFEVAKAVGADSRIGNKFLNASVGFGGSCFKKDILNLVYLCNHYGLDEVGEYWHQVLKINDFQKQRFSSRIIKILGDNIKSKVVSIFGWSFKKDTNDSRESASIDVAKTLLDEGVNIKIYDPMVSKETILNDIIKTVSLNAQEQILKKITICDNIIDAAKYSNCIAILTEWDEFKSIDWTELSNLIDNELFIADGRNLINPNEIENLVNYISVGNTKLRNFD
tara:strand:+ start:7960 stop:9390 length:1431 start_codon:yes stop_codon:yes gene_type:complete